MRASNICVKHCTLAEITSSPRLCENRTKSNRLRHLVVRSVVTMKVVEDVAGAAVGVVAVVVAANIVVQRKWKTALRPILTPLSMVLAAAVVAVAAVVSVGVVVAVAVETAAAVGIAVDTVEIAVDTVVIAVDTAGIAVDTVDVVVIAGLPVLPAAVASAPRVRLRLQRRRPTLSGWATIGLVSAENTPLAAPFARSVCRYLEGRLCVNCISLSPRSASPIHGVAGPNVMLTPLVKTVA